MARRLTLFITASLPLTLWSAHTLSQTTPPATAPTTRPATRAIDATATLNRMLRPSAPAAHPLQPLPDTPVNDLTSGNSAVTPNAPSVKLLREGTFITDRIGRLHKTDDGQHMELLFDSDGAALQDPPMVILPNLALMQMENAVVDNRDKKFRVTGTVTEYRGRNCILLDKAVPITPTP